MKFVLDTSDITNCDNVTVEGRTSQKENRTRELINNEQCSAPSYKENNESENACNAIVSDFVQRLQREYPESSIHNRLMIVAENEFGVSKCVCSTLKPTLLPHPSIYNSSDCSRFVANYLHYEPLKEPSQPPKLLPSPSQVLKWGIGDCFDLSIILASFLIGAGYDAYVVHGTAPNWICNRDRTKENLPFHQRGSPHSAEEQENIGRALVEMRRIMNTNVFCAEDNFTTSNLVNDEKNESTDKSIYDKDSLDKDQSHSHGIHSWVLIKSNLRCPVGTDDYYIEPSTGYQYQLSSCPYHRVDAIWNCKNYWVNTREQNLTQNVSLTEEDGWLGVFLNKGNNDGDCQRNSDVGRERFDPPFSWVDKLSIPEESFAFMYPAEGRRVVLYNKLKFEFFSNDIQKQGLEERITEFEGRSMLNPTKCVEYFRKSRKDSLVLRVKLLQNHCFYESYSPLNQYSMKECVELSGEARTIKFHSKGRPDSLISIEETNGQTIIHTYEERRDRLSQRIINLVWITEAKGKVKDRLVLPSGDGGQNAIVINIIEEYSPPTSQGRALQIASRCLCLKRKTLETQYFDSHGNIDSTKVVQSKRRECNLTVVDDDELLSHQRMNNAEKEMVAAVRNLHQETLDLVRSRKRDEDPLRSGIPCNIDKNKVVSSPKVQSVTSERKDVMQNGVDYLSPYLFFVKDIHHITRIEAEQIRDSCLATTKERLLERANIIQGRLNEEHQRLTQSQAIYQQKLESDSESKQTFEKLCVEIAFKTKILERRLQEHEDSSLDKLKKLENKLKEDSRLKRLYRSDD